MLQKPACRFVVAMYGRLVAMSVCPIIWSIAALVWDWHVMSLQALKCGRGLFQCCCWQQVQAWIGIFFIAPI